MDKALQFNDLYKLFLSSHFVACKLDEQQFFHLLHTTSSIYEFHGKVVCIAVLYVALAMVLCEADMQLLYSVMKD